MYIAVLVGLVCLSIGLQVLAGVVGLWFSQIIFFDSALTGVAAGMACNHFAHIHPAICIVIGLAAFFLIFMFFYSFSPFYFTDNGSYLLIFVRALLTEDIF